MTKWIDRGRMVNRVPVVEGRRKEKCDACGVANTPLRLDMIGTDELGLCVDFETCCKRYRLGMNVSQFSRYLRGMSATLTGR